MLRSTAYRKWEARVNIVRLMTVLPPTVNWNTQIFQGIIRVRGRADSANVLKRKGGRQST